MSRYVKAAEGLGVSQELDRYLERHPEVGATVKRAMKAEELFSGFLRLAGLRLIVRDVPSGSTAEADFNAALSRTDF